MLADLLGATGAPGNAESHRAPFLALTATEIVLEGSALGTLVERTSVQHIKAANCAAGNFATSRHRLRNSVSVAFN